MSKTIELKQGSRITITPNAAEKSITFSAEPQVVNNLNGNQTDVAPSVAAVKAALPTVIFTQAEKEKLAGLESSHFRGEFASAAALGAVTGAAGDYAYVDTGAGGDVTTYIWDTSDNKWVEQKGVTTAETAATVKSKYESNPDTNAFTDALKTKLNGVQTGATANAPSSTAPKAAGAAAAGTEGNFARGDHVHPAQTSVSGNAGTATKLATARTISLSGDVTGSVNFDGSASATIPATVSDGIFNIKVGTITI